MSRRALAAAVLVLGLLARPGAVAAQPRVGQRTIGVRWEHGLPRISFSARDLVNADVRRKLESGLPQTLVMRVYAYPESSGSPIALGAQTCRVVYDLWEEVYRVQVQTAGASRSVAETSIDGVVRRCLVASPITVGSTADWAPRRGTRAYFAVLIEHNPMSPETVQRIRRWLARPGGGRVESDAFFGSFVSLFVNRRIGSAERVLTFRSQAVAVP